MRTESFYHKITKLTLLNLLICLLIMGCSKDNELELIKSQKPESNDKISKLLDQAYKSGTQEEYNAITRKYEKLTPEEFELFLKLRTERDILRINYNHFTNGRLSIEEKESIINSVKVAESIRRDMNKLSLNLFGRSLNQLEDKKVIEVFSKFSKDKKFNTYLEKLGITPKNNGRVQGCPLRSYPNPTGRFNSGGTYWGGLNNVETVAGESPCDYEFSFWGKFNKIRPGNWFSDRLLASWSYIKYRQGPGGFPTYIVLGWGYTTAWIGDARLTSIYMTY